MSIIPQFSNMVSEVNGNRSSSFTDGGSSVQPESVTHGFPRTSSRSSTKSNSSPLRASAEPFLLLTEQNRSCAHGERNRLQAASEQGPVLEPEGNAFAPWLPFLKPLLFDAHPPLNVSFTPGGGFELTQRTERLPSDGVKFEARDSELGEGISEKSHLYIRFNGFYLSDISYMQTEVSCLAADSLESDSLMSGKSSLFFKSEP